MDSLEYRPQMLWQKQNPHSINLNNFDSQSSPPFAVATPLHKPKLTN